MKRLIPMTLCSMLLATSAMAEGRSLTETLRPQFERIKRMQACQENPNWKQDPYCRALRQGANGSEDLDELRDEISNLDFRLMVIEDRINEIEDIMSDLDWRIHEVEVENR